MNFLLWSKIPSWRDIFSCQIASVCLKLDSELITDLCCLLCNVRGVWLFCCFAQFYHCLTIGPTIAGVNLGRNVCEGEREREREMVSLVNTETGRDGYQPGIHLHIYTNTLYLLVWHKCTISSSAFTYIYIYEYNHYAIIMLPNWGQFNNVLSLKNRNI